MRSIRLLSVLLIAALLMACGISRNEANRALRISSRHMTNFDKATIPFAIRSCRRKGIKLVIYDAETKKELITSAE